MKIKILFVISLFILGGCSLLSSGPKATLESYLSHAQKYEPDEMFSLMSDRLIKEVGADKIKEDNEKFADAVQGGNYKMQVINETASGDKAKIVFFYRDTKRNDSVRLGFKFVKQGSEWKIDGYGYGDPDDESSETNNSQPASSDVIPPTPSDELIPPPPPEPETAKTPKNKR